HWLSVLPADIRSDDHNLARLGPNFDNRKLPDTGFGGIADGYTRRNPNVSCIDQHRLLLSISNPTAYELDIAGFRETAIRSEFDSCVVSASLLRRAASVGQVRTEEGDMVSGFN